MARQPQPYDDEDDMRRALVTLEQGGSAQLPGGQVINERTIFGDIITAQPVKMPRNEPRVLQRIDAMAQANGEKWYYRFPVKNRRTGKTDYIEGPSIECTGSVARYYGNCQVQTALAAETPTQWIFASRFVDLETGYSLIRPFLQPKSGGKIGGLDDERRMQAAFGIGVSKCERNVVDKALNDMVDRAFKGAKQNLVDKIGRNLPDARQRCQRGIEQLGVELQRVEQVYGRKLGDMLAPDIARLVAELRAVADGMASVDEAWPPPAAPEPTRRDDETTAASHSESGGEHGGPAAAPHTSASPPPPADEATKGDAAAAGLSRGQDDRNPS